MKSIEEIQNMSLESLEEIADNASVKAPATLGAKLGESMTAAAVRKQLGEGHRALYAAVGSLAVVAASVAVLLSLPQQPKDTFSDPAQAYAELERTFSYISSKVGMGLEIVQEAGPAMERTSEIIDKINHR